MNVDLYREKLHKFNSGEKYDKELLFLIDKLSISSDSILDYGCGTGYAMGKIHEQFDVDICGFDVISGLYETHFLPLYSKWTDLPGVDKVYFMHSFAHIVPIDIVVGVLKEDILHAEGEIHVITPNKSCLDKIDNPDYIPDPTVYRHYYMDEMIEIFKKAGFEDIQCIEFGDQINGIPERLYLKAK